MILLQHEGQLDQFVDFTEGTKSGKRGKGKDSENAGSKANIIKTMMTEHMSTAMRLEYDKKTKKPETRHYKGKTHNLFIVNFNSNVRQYVETSSFSRMIVKEQKKPLTGGTADPVMQQFRPESIEDDDTLQKLGLTLKLMHGHLVVIEWLLGCKSRAGTDVEDSMAKIFVAQVHAALNRLGIPASETTPRKMQYVIALSRSLCIMQASFSLLGTAEGHAFLEEKRCHAFSETAFYEFIFPRLVITMDQVAFVMTLLSFQYQMPWDGDIAMMFAHMAGLKEQGTIEPLTTYFSDIKGDHATFDSLGLAKPVVDDTGGSMIGISGIGVSPPVPVGDGGSSSTKASMVVHDHRYIVMSQPSLKALVNVLGHEIAANVQSRPRDEAIEAFFFAKQKLWVNSRFYDVVDGELKIVGKDMTSPIPAFVWRDQISTSTSLVKRNARQNQVYGIAIDYLVQYHHVPVIAEHVAEIEKIFREMYGLEDTDDLSSRVNLDILARLRPQRVTYSHARTEHFLNNIKYADPGDVVVAAMRQVLATPVFGIFRPWSREAGAARPDETERPYREFLVFTNPKNFYLQVEHKRNVVTEHFVILEHIMQLMRVTRKPDAQLPVVENIARADAVAMAQILSTLGLEFENFESSKESRLLSYFNTPGTVLDADLDYISSMMSADLSLTQQMVTANRARARKLYMDPEIGSLMPFSIQDYDYGLNFNIPSIASALFTAHDFKARKAQCGTAATYQSNLVRHYPGAALYQVIKDVRTRRKEQSTGEYRHVKRVTKTWMGDVEERMAQDSRLREEHMDLDLIDDMARAS